MFRRSKRPAVTRRAMKVIVQAFRDCEEVAAGVDHGPPCVDASPTRIRDEAPEKFGNAASPGRRADVPDHAPLKQRLCALDGPLQIFELLLREDRAKSIGRQGGDLDLGEERHPEEYSL